jgi:HEAT repeat protein
MKEEKVAEIDRLISTFSSQDRKVREEARRSLIIIGEPAVIPLVQGLMNRDKWVRWEIAKTLAEMRHPEAAPLLVKELESRDPDIRWLAAEGLIALGSHGLEPLFKALVDNPDSEVLRLSAHHVLRDLYKDELHEGEEEYKPLYKLNEVQREAVKKVLGAMDNLGSHLLLPTTAKIALDNAVRQRMSSAPSNPDYPD